MVEGRIIKGVGGLYSVAVGTDIYECSVRGIFRKKGIIPTVGDYVELSVLDEANKKASIDKILPRKNQLIRPRVVNIDVAILTFAAKSPAINWDMLDRFIILAQRQKIERIVLCINKADLVSERELDDIKRIYAPMYEVVFTSALNNEGIDKLREIVDKRVSVLAGPSGVGKSSLVNCLFPNVRLQAVGEISKKIQRGKHTTRQVELIEACEDTYIVDSPGFTSLSLEGIRKEELCRLFKEFEPYLDDCRFSDCSHINEPDCSVKEQLGKTISQERYNRFLSFYEEILSYD